MRAGLGKVEGLSPGMFVNVSVVLPDQRKVILIGATSLVVSEAALGELKGRAV